MMLYCKNLHVSKLEKTAVFVVTGVRFSQVDTKILHNTVRRYAWVTVLQTYLYQFIYVGSTTTGNIESSVWLIGRSQWPLSLRRGSADLRLLRLLVRIPPLAWISVVSVVCCAGRGLCDGLITRLEDSYRLL